ncbi:hypothetical protein [Neisseria sp. HMSC068C04]|uniref:hypothetical protein n=1 Tax=Neisseria sp. HMSC068C04 TaxID=1715179 RepID=UPI00114CD37E|nr:hypothetical protein [Neisseria sp. HMSC068C04]
MLPHTGLFLLGKVALQIRIRHRLKFNLSDGLLTSQLNSRKLKKNSPNLSFSSVQDFNLIKPCFALKQAFLSTNPTSLNYYYSTEKAV